MEDFLQYDFIGAPIDPKLGFGEGFNGGLSLRNRSMMLDIVRWYDWKVDKKFEDQVCGFPVQRSVLIFDSGSLRR